MGAPINASLAALWELQPTAGRSWLFWRRFEVCLSASVSLPGVSRNTSAQINIKTRRKKAENALVQHNSEAPTSAAGRKTPAQQDFKHREVLIREQSDWFSKQQKRKYFNWNIIVPSDLQLDYFIK